MTVVVAYKWARNPQDVSIGADGTLDLSRAKGAVSEYDPVAIEVARQLADALGTELVGVSVGGEDAGSPMARKAALSRGLDRAVLVADAAYDDAGSTATARALAALVARVDDVQVVVTGDSSVDVGAHLVPTVLAGELGWPALAQVSAVRPVDGGLEVEQAAGGGTRTLGVSGPAVLAVATDAALPRVPGMKDILSAGKKPVELLAPADLGVAPAAAAVQVRSLARPETPARRGRLIDATDPAAAAAELVAALRADAVL
jgi:electron transfer flavoprotein beta subunit